MVKMLKHWFVFGMSEQMLFIFLSIIGLQNNRILSKNFNVLTTCDSNEGDISALLNCGNEIAI